MLRFTKICFGIALGLAFAATVYAQHFGGGPTTRPLAAAYGNTPMSLRYFGDASDGAGPASGAITNTVNMYSAWTCTGAVTFAQGTIIMSQGPIALNSGCSVMRTTGNTGVGDFGGAGGSGGSGAGNSSAGGAVTYLGTTYDAGGLASSSGAGNTPTALSAAQIRGEWLLSPHWNDVLTGLFTGGAAGSAGGSSGGAKGNGGFALIIIAPSITIASGVTLDTSGFPGTQAAAISTGAGGGGGGAPIELAATNITDSGGIYKYGGGPGGACHQPSIQATGGGCDSGANGCGTGALFTVTGLTTGGLDASKVTISAAGSGYQTAPTCTVNAGTSSITGTPACHFTLTSHAIGSVVIDTPGSGGTLTTYTTCFAGGYGANGYMKEFTIQ